MNKLLCILVMSCFSGAAMAQDPSAACIQQLSGDERFQLLFKKAPLDITKGQPIEVLANQSKATPKDKAALSILVPKLDRCTVLGADWRKQNYPASINGYVSTYQSFLRSAMAEVYAGKMTFGDFAKVRGRELTELTNKVGIESQRIQAQRVTEMQQQEQEAKAEDEQRQATARRAAEQAEAQRRYGEQQAIQADESRRQAAMQFLLNQRQAQPYQMQPYQMPIPKTTNCSTYGNQTNCTTR